MNFNIPLDKTPAKYPFSFTKNSVYKKKTLFNLDSKGIISLFREQEEQSEAIVQYTFRSLEYIQKNVQSPLLFNPVKWIYNTGLNVAAIKNKENHRLVWNKYRDKYKNPQNQTALMAVERLYFHTPLGLEYDAFSNGTYLLFFLPLDIGIKKETIIKGLDWLLMPINIPLNTTFKCINIDTQYITFKGWVSLDEKMLDELLRKDNFKNKAKKYHFSKDFQLESEIDLTIEVATKRLYKAEFNLKVKGEKEELYEIMNYSIHSEQYDIKYGVYKTHKGKSYTKEEWEDFEQEQFKEYARKNNIPLGEEKPKKGGRFFLDEKESDF